MTSCRATDRRGFTLIEMLAVMVILGILLGLSTLALSDLGRGQGARGSVSAFVATAALARQHAVTYASPTSVVLLPPDAALYTDLERLRPRAGRAYAVYAVDPETQEGRFVAEWTTLADGLVFEVASGLDACVFEASEATRVSVSLRRDGGTNLVVRTLPAIRFRPNGSAFRSQGYQVGITEGAVDLDPDTRALTLRRRGGSRLLAEVGVGGFSGAVTLRSYGVAP